METAIIGGSFLLRERIEHAEAPAHSVKKKWPIEETGSGRSWGFYTDWSMRLEARFAIRSRHLERVLLSFIFIYFL